jgi:hypothetical protein
MRRWVWAVCLLFACCSFAAAQLEEPIFKIPNSEIYGGYAWQHAGLDGALAQTQGFVTQDSASLKGFAVGYAHYFQNNVGFALEISRVSNGRLDTTGIGYTRTSYLGGPSVRLHRYGFFSPSLHVLAGVDHATFKVPSAGTTFKFSDTDVAVLGGGTLDGNLSKHLALRLVQMDYLYSHHYGQSQSSFRYSGGIVIRF